jgi:pectinesterase
VKAQPKGVSDTARIQDALNLCAPGKAVVLISDAGNRSFFSAPLILPRGVTLFVDTGVTLYASANPRDYDLTPNSCGAKPATKAPACKPFIYSYQAAYSGVEGNGVIDGQGGVWWPKNYDSAPDLVSSYESQGFHIKGISLHNAAGVHAAIFKTIGLRMSSVRIDSTGNTTGVLLSNAVDAQISFSSIKTPGKSLVLTSSILGPTENVRVSDTYMVGGGVSIGDDVRMVAFEGDLIEGPITGETHASWNRVCLAGHIPAGSVCELARTTSNIFDVDLSTVDRPGTSRSVVVRNGESIQKAIDTLPFTGGEVTVEPGTYREVVTIRKPNVHIHGSDPDPKKTTIVFDNGSVKNGGTFNSATVFVEADEVSIDHLSIVNDLGSGKGQAVALHVTGDRATFRNLRLSGAQDTLFSASRYCYGDYGPCVATRHYFADCFIEGNTDFIFGDSKAVFERSELHGISTGSVMYTAQSKHTADQDSGYVFNHCVITGDARDKGFLTLGRPWRPYATVVLLDTRIDAPVIAAGWTEWARFGIPSLPTAYYAEYRSTGPGANAAAREPHSHQLTADEGAKWSTKAFLGWDPR